LAFFEASIIFEAIGEVEKIGLSQTNIITKFNQVKRVQVMLNVSEKNFAELGLQNDAAKKFELSSPYLLSSM